MNREPSYRELLELNYHLTEQCKYLENIIREQELQIAELLTASILYRELYMKLDHSNKK